MRADEILQAFLPSPVLNAGFEFREFHLYDRLAILIADMDAVRPESIPDCHRFSAEFQMRQLGHQLRSLPLTMQCMEAKNIDTSVRFYMRSMKAFAKMAQTVNTAVRNSVFLEHCDLLVQADDILITFKQDDAFRGRTVTRQGEVLHVGRLMMSIDRRAIHLQRALRLGLQLTAGSRFERDFILTASDALRAADEIEHRKFASSVRQLCQDMREPVSQSLKPRFSAKDRFDRHLAD